MSRFRNYSLCDENTFQSSQLIKHVAQVVRGVVKLKMITSLSQSDMFGSKVVGRCRLLAASMLNPKFMPHRNFFTARVYAKLLHNDPYGRISIMQFFNYVMRKGLYLLFQLG